MTGVSSGADFWKFGECLGVHDGAGKLVRANFATFFENVNIFGGKLGLCPASVVLLDEIREIKCAAQPGRTGADDEDVRFELFALDGHGDSLPNRCLVKRCHQDTALARPNFWPFEVLR